MENMSNHGEIIPPRIDDIIQPPDYEGHQALEREVHERLRLWMPNDEAVQDWMSTAYRNEPFNGRTPASMWRYEAEILYDYVMTSFPMK